MIRIDDFNGLMSQMMLDINADQMNESANSWFTIAGLVLVANEKHLVKRLGDAAGIWLAVTLPSADPASFNEDGVAENNIAWIFALEKTDPGSFTTDEELQHYQKMQNVISAVKNWLLTQKQEGNELLFQLDINSLHTDPEYQFGGWNGWALSFNFDTDGY